MLVFGAQISDVFAKNGRYYSVVCQKKAANYRCLSKKGRQLSLFFVNRAISRLKRLILAIPLFLTKNGHCYSVVLSKKGAIYPLFRQKGTPLFRTFCQIAFLLWTEKPRFRPI